MPSADESMDDSQEENSGPISDEEISRRMAKLYVKNGLTQVALRDFAILFRDAGHDVYIDPRVILRTRKETVGDTDFVHLGLRKGILAKLNKGVHPYQVFFFQFNIYPILCQYVE